MFKAFIIVCAASSISVDRSSCIMLDDQWGPYKTEENCDIRAAQMTNDVLTGELSEIMFQVLGDPQFLYAEGYCEEINLDPAT